VLIRCELFLCVAAADRDRRIATNPIPRGVHNLPFAREHIMMCDFVIGAQIRTRISLFLDLSDRDRTAARSLECVPPKFMLSDYGAALEQMFFRP
jgi:hypothetical protein